MTDKPHLASSGDWANAQTMASLESGDGYYPLRCILELRARIEALEAEPPKRPGLLTMALEGRVDGLYASLAHALRRIEELEQRPIAGTVELAAPIPEAAPVATDDELRALSSMEVWTVDARRALYNLGREHGAAAAQPAPPAAPAPAGGLVKRIAGVLDSYGTGGWEGEACAVIREVAAWMRENDRTHAALYLEQEADRG